MKDQITLTEKEKVDRLIKYLIDTDDSAENFKEYKDIKRHMLYGIAAMIETRFDE